MFSGSIKRNQWHEMDYDKVNIRLIYWFRKICEISFIFDNVSQVMTLKRRFCFQNHNFLTRNLLFYEQIFKGFISKIELNPLLRNVVKWSHTLKILQHKSCFIKLRTTKSVFCLTFAKDAPVGVFLRNLRNFAEYLFCGSAQKNDRFLNSFLL